MQISSLAENDFIIGRSAIWLAYYINAADMSGIPVMKPKLNVAFGRSKEVVAVSPGKRHRPGVRPFRHAGWKYDVWLAEHDAADINIISWDGRYRHMNATIIEVSHWQAILSRHE